MRAPAVLLFVAGFALRPISADAAPPEEADPDSATTNAAPDDEAARAKARAEVKAGSAAFREGDYETALRHYSRASEIRASRKLHYNIAVCHHRLMIAAANEDARQFHNDQAIGAYNRYLEANPDAPDRGEVADTVRSLGGTPTTNRGLKDAFEGVEDLVEPEDELEMPAEDSPDDQSEPPAAPLEAEPVPDSGPQPLERYHARGYLAPQIGVVPQLVNNSDVAGAVSLQFEAKAMGSLGPRGLNQVGVELAFWGGSGTANQLSFSAGYAAFAYDRDFLPGQKQRIVVSVGASLGGGRQAIRTTETAGPPRCAARDADGKLKENERLVAARWGGVANVRFNLGVLFGARRNHEANFSAHPQLGFYLEGTPGTAEDGDGECKGDEAKPFRFLGVPRVMASIWAGFGYAFRF